MNIIIQLSLILLLFCTINSFSQDFDSEIESNHDSEGEMHNAHFHRNHFGVFLGATTELEEDKDTHFTLGIDYTRRITNNGRWGLGVFGEAIFANHTEWLFGIPLYFYPTNKLWLRAGPGVEFHKKKKESGKETEAEFLIRTGIGYSIELNKFTIAPSFSVDFLRNKTSLVWGISILKEF